MSRHVEGPFFRKSKNTWYVTHEGRKVSLRVSGKNNRKTAVEAWHRLLREGRPTPNVAPKPLTNTIAEAVAEFLSVVAVRNKPTTLDLYQRHLNKLTAKLGKSPVSALTVPVLAKWLKELKVSSTTQAITLRSVSVFLGWCVRQELLDSNPACAVAKPKAKSRGEESVISPEQHAKLMELATPQLRLVLTLLHATGARPGEVCAITAENFDPAAGVVKLTQHKTDHTGRLRLILLPPEAVELLKVQVAKYGTGPLLRHRQGRAWTPKVIANRVRLICKRAGMKVIPYGYRHTLATDALAQGVPDAHVAQLLGHGSTAMLYKHYSHLSAKTKVMAEALKKVR
jgi:integrase